MSEGKGNFRIEPDWFLRCCGTCPELDDEDRINYIKAMNTERDTYNQIEYARETGREEGHKVGKEEGLKEGQGRARRGTIEDRDESYKTWDTLQDYRTSHRVLRGRSIQAKERDE